MSEQEIVTGLDKIQELCGLVVNRMSVAKKQGRMLSMDEARKMDQRSSELIRMIKLLSNHSITNIQTPELRRRAETLLDLSQSTLKLVVQSDFIASRSQTKAIPRAASNRVAAYGVC